MPSFGFCTRLEYEQGINDRLQPTDIGLDEVYTFMAALDMRHCEQGEAVAAPIKVQGQPRIHTPGLYAIHFALLDPDDLLPIPTSDSEVDYLYFGSDGMLVRTPEFRRQDPGLLEGYLSNYQDGFGDALKAILDQAVPQPA